MGRGNARSRWLAAGLALAIGSCETVAPAPSTPSHEAVEDPVGEVEPGPREEPPPDAGEVPRLPQDGQLYPETQVRLAAGDPRDADHLADVTTCGECHPDVLETWRSSAHSRASFDNPWYRQSVDALREESGFEASRFCAGCHDPVLLVADAMDAPVEPDDPRAHAGITCNVCHGIQSARSDGNGSYTLSTRPIPLPDPADEEEIREHVEAATPDPLRTERLCGSCHRGFLGEHMGNPHFLGGADDVTPYRRSGYAGSPASRIDEPVEEQTCQDCHMPAARARHAEMAADAERRFTSHRFAGAHTALAFAATDMVQLVAIDERLREAARIDIASLRSPRAPRRRWAPPDNAEVRAGEALELDVTVRNVGAGHRFPGGTLDTQDTWVEIDVHDADGLLIAQHGAAHALLADPGDDDEASAHRLLAVLADDDAAPRFLHRVQGFRAKVLDRTIGPRDAQVVRYSFTLPRAVAFPLSIRARLRHRRHHRDLHDAACEAVRSARGRAFDATSRTLGRTPLDACRPQPITELAYARVFVGAGASDHASEGGASDRPFRRHFDHALGLIADVQEHLDAARPVIEAALEAAQTDHERAMALYQRGRLEARQGRLEEALADADRVEELIGEHPSVARLRGDAFAQVWRWEDAALHYAAAAQGAPRDESRFVDLARARGSAGDDEGALAAALVGLRLSPRDESLLRSQYLALEHLGRPGVDPARAAYLSHRVPDALPVLRERCGQQHDWCRLERLPVHTHPLEPAP